MLQIRYLTLIFTSFCMGLSACAPTVDIPSASPSITPTTISTQIPTATGVPPTSTLALSMSLMLQDEGLAASGFVVEEKEDGIMVLWDHDEGEEHEVFKLNPDGSAVFWGIRTGEGGIVEGQIREEVVFSKEQMHGYQVAYEPTLVGDRARVILKDENGKVVSYYQDDVNSWRDEDAASSFVPMGQEIFTQMFGSGGEQNKIAVSEWVKANWDLGDKDIVTLTGDNGYVTVDRFDEETGKREAKFYSLITGEERFDTKVAENYADNNWESDPEWQPTQSSRVTVMGHVEGLPVDIPISIGAVQSSDIDRIVPSQDMADALAKAYIEAYRNRYNMQNGTEYTWEEYLKMLQQGKGAPTVPQPNADEQSYYKYTKDGQFNPLAGVAIVFVDNRNKDSNLPVKIEVPGTTLKIHIDNNGRLVIMMDFIGNSVTYDFAEGEAKSSGGKVSADEIFTVGRTTYPAQIIRSWPDSYLRDNSTGSIVESRKLFFSDDNRQFNAQITESTIEARKAGTLTESLLEDFQHTIPPQRR